MFRKPGVSYYIDGAHTPESLEVKRGWVVVVVVVCMRMEEGLEWRWYVKGWSGGDGGV